MPTQTFYCPHCGGPINYQEGDALSVKCRFCGHTVIVPEELRRPGPTVTVAGGLKRIAVLIWAGGAAVILLSLAILLAVLLRPVSSGEVMTPPNQAVNPANSPSPTAALMITATPPPTASLSPDDPCLLGLFKGGVSHNADWEPCIADINGMRFALVPPGCFNMGSDSGDANQQPAHRVCFTQPYWIGVGKVTQGQFRVMNGYSAEAPFFTGDALPRELINWKEASAFCQTQGGSLPTEAQWEYAARGPDDLLYPWGNAFVRDYVIDADNSGGKTASVFARGGFSWVGAVDMLGNVYEWVADWYGPYPSGDQTDPTGPATGTDRVLRGGSYRVAADKITATARLYTSPSNSSNDLGFRCAKEY